MRSPRDRSIDAVARQTRDRVAKTMREAQSQAVAQVLRWHRDYSLREIGLVLGRGTSSVHRWVGGESMPDLSVAQEILRRADQLTRNLKHNREVTDR